ncbi:MAG: UDP-N-acetylglucosamine 2-epimerase [Candidatus Omnitrophota bacterium]
MKPLICAVTGSRAEYGLFHPLLKELRNEPSMRLGIAVTGMHLSSLYGLTYKEIERDGFSIDAKIAIPLKDDSPEGIARSLGKGVMGFATAFKRLKPDFVLVLGDRFETYSAVIAAFVSRIPVIHLYGGELTEGAMDDAFRHSITKMSSLHFTSTEVYRRRVIQLGEDPRKVFNVGGLGVDNARQDGYFSRRQLEKALRFKIHSPVALVTFHPTTLEHNTSAKQFDEILAALSVLKGLKVVFTKPNSDTNGRILIESIDRYVANHRGSSVSFVSLGRLKYLSLLKCVDVMVGNSSSGLIEMPSFGKPTVNVGDRQRGRIRAASVMDCPAERARIKSALKKALSPRFRAACARVKNPYEGRSTAKTIAAILKKELPRIRSLKKTFYDLPLRAEL